MDISINAVKAIIELDGKILLLQRNKDIRKEDNWDLPGGLIENNQSEKETLYREITEELNIEIDIIKPFGNWKFTRLKDGKVVLVKNFLCKMKSCNFEIQLSEEHSSYIWIEPRQIADYPIKDRSLKESIYTEFNIT